MSGSIAEFLGSPYQTALLLLGPYSRWWPAAILKISDGSISAVGHPIHVMFGSMVRFLEENNAQRLYIKLAQSKAFLVGHKFKTIFLLSPCRVCEC